MSRAWIPAVALAPLAAGLIVLGANVTAEKPGAQSSSQSSAVVASAPAGALSTKQFMW